MRAVIQSQFAILKLRSTLREVKKKRFVPCQKREVKLVNLMMLDLPLDV